MANKDKNSCSCMPSGGFKVEAIVSVDERGQTVIPKDTREKAGIHAGDKLALISFESGGKICCLSLIKAEELAGMVKGILGPMMEEVTK